MAKQLQSVAMILTIGLLLASFLPPAAWAATPLDYDLPGGAGHFYTQANGHGGAGGTGYAITNADGIPFWDAYQRLGGPNVLAHFGLPMSYADEGNSFVVRAQRAVF